MYVIYFNRLQLYYCIITIIDYEVYTLLLSCGILICFKCLIFIITCFMQISRNYISMKFYYQIHKKEINLVTLDEFQILHVYFTRKCDVRNNFLF